MRRVAAALWLGVVLAAALMVGLRLHQGVELRSDLVALLPGEAAGEAALRARLSDALARRVVLLVGAPERAAARAAASALAERLEAEGLGRFSSGGLDAAGMRAVGEVYAPHRRGLLAEADRALLAEGRFDALGERAAARFFGLPGLVQGRQIAADPFLLLTDFFAALPLPASRLRPDAGMLSLTEGGTTWVMLTGTLAAEPYALDTQKRLAAALEAVPAGTHVLRLGAAFFAGAGAERGLAESSTLGGLSLVAMVLLVLAAFRSLRVLGVTLLCVGAGIVAATAAVLGLFAAPHAGALIFGVGLIGAVMDYALQYAAESYAGPAAPGRRLRRVFAGISVGAATTIIGYLTLWLAPFPGLRQVAVFAAVGLGGAWLSVVLWMPLFDRGGPDLSRARLPVWCGRAMAGRRGGMALVLAGVALAGLPFLRANDDIRGMQPPDSALMAEQARISALLGTATPRFLAISAPDDEAALRTEEALQARLVPLRGKALAGWQMPAAFVPSAARQAENAALAGRLLGAPTAAQAARLGIDPPPPAPQVPPLTLAEARRVLPFLDALVLPSAAGGGAVHLVALEKLADPSALRAAIAGLAGVRLVDPAEDFSQVLARYRERAVALLALSAALMAPVLLWRYRRRAWRVLAAPLLAVAATPALRALGGGGFSFFDAMGLVLTLSMGVDYAVFCAEGRPARRNVTAAGVSLAAVTTLLSFGILAASAVPAVRGFGLTLAIGITLSWLLAPLAAPVAGAPSPHWARLRERGTALGFALARLVVRLGGRRGGRALLAGVAAWFWLTDARRRGWCRAYLRRVGSRRPGRDSLALFVRFAWRGLDNFLALARPELAPPVQVAGLEAIRPLLAAGRGGVLLVSHHGNVEICRSVLAGGLGRRMTVLMHTAQAARYNALMRRFGREGATETLEVGAFGPAAAMALAERVEAGEWIAIAADRPPLSGERRACRVPFLGAPAAFAEGPFLIAALLGCPVVALFCIAGEAGYTARLERFAERIVLPRHGREAALAEWAARYAARLEAECRREPLQWFNFFDFWAADEAA